MTEDITSVGWDSVQSGGEACFEGVEGFFFFKKRNFCMGKKAQRGRQSCEALEGVVVVLSDRNVFIVLFILFFFF